MRVLMVCLLLGSGCFGVSAAAATPVIFDTDIGTDIDDAYALAALIHRPELELIGVTTVSSDAIARARLAAKLLQVAGDRWAKVPVYAGTSTPTQYMKQVDWAKGFSSASWLVTVGDSRASIGEPMKVMVAGRLSSLSSLISEAAASTAGPGWHTATTCGRGPSTRSMSRTWSM